MLKVVNCLAKNTHSFVAKSQGVDLSCLQTTNAAHHSVIKPVGSQCFGSQERSECASACVNVRNV